MKNNLEGVLEFLRKEGPKSMRELEENPPKGMSGDEARIAIERLTDSYEVVGINKNCKFCIYPNVNYFVTDNNVVKIRDFFPGDVERVLELWKKTGLYFDRWDTKENLLNKYRIEKSLKSPLFVVAEDKVIVGAVMGVYNGWVAKIDHLAVDPDYQDEGLGTILMKEIEARFKKNGAKTILLDVKMDNNKVLGFYKKIGYVKKASTYSLGKDLK